MQLFIQSKGMWMFKQAQLWRCSVPALVLRPYCNLQHRNTVKCQSTVVKLGGGEWKEANMQLFLIESAQSGVLAVLHSGQDQDHLWCWPEKGASSAGTQGKHSAPFLCIFPRLFDIVKNLIVGTKKGFRV